MGLIQPIEFKIDIVDLHILEHLRQNSRIHYVRIAEELGISEGTVRGRVNKMCEKGVIKKFTIISNNDRGVKTIIFLRVDPNFIESNLNLLKCIEKVETIKEISGDFNIMISSAFNDFDEFRNFIWKHINTLDGLKNMKSFIIMKRYKDELIPKLV
ncbi:MAG: Lrp/AsnC family transcriptional regulator [Candidatus Helarchaeota archaeon]